MQGGSPHRLTTRRAYSHRRRIQIPMKVTELDEALIQKIGHAFGCYDYGAEHGLIDAFPS